MTYAALFVTGARVVKVKGVILLLNQCSGLSEAGIPTRGLQVRLIIYLNLDF